MTRRSVRSVRLSRTWALAACLIPFALGGCSTTDEPAYAEKPAEVLYEEAFAALEEGAPQKATELFDEVERQHPYSPWANRAQILSAYTHYENLKYDEAILALERFIQLHPGSDQLPYAYYLRALCYYEQIADITRDQRNTHHALEALQEVVSRFPTTEYARDAAVKIDLANDHIAGKEMEIGRFYLRQQQYNAALGRFRAVVEQYQTTSHIPEALHRLTEIYVALGIPDEARKTAAVLGHNFPGSEWYQDSYALLIDPSARPADSTGGSGTGSWLGRTWNSLF